MGIGLVGVLWACSWLGNYSCVLRDGVEAWRLGLGSGAFSLRLYGSNAPPARPWTMAGISIDLRTLARSVVPTAGVGRSSSASVTVPIWLLALPWIVAVAVSGSALKDIRRSQRLCVCGYESSGLGTYDCPECGRTLDAEALGDPSA